MKDGDSLPDDVPDNIKEFIRRISRGDFPDELPGNLSDYFSSIAMLSSSGMGAPPAMSREPDGVELLKGVAPAEWVAERLWRSAPHKGLLVGSLIPEGFEAYARIFHPASYQSDDREWHRVSWATVADWYGKVVHPQMTFPRLVNLDWLEHPSWGSLPEMGTLPEVECKPLLDVLREFTTTPESCYFAVWEGYGGFDERVGKGVAKLASPFLDRKYYIFHGPLDSVMSFCQWEFFLQAPNIWWPENRAWCVATEIDDLETYVGGSAACIERVLAHPELEALPIALDARVDAFGDTVNG